MFGFLLLLFIVLPLVELYIIIEVSGALGGALNTIALLILISVVGAWLVRREGFAVLQRAQRLVTQGEVPSNEIIDGMLIVVAGALMLTPGFLTDAFGLALLLPPSRALLRGVLRKRFQVQTGFIGGPGRGRGPGSGPGIDPPIDI